MVAWLLLIIVSCVLCLVYSLKQKISQGPPKCVLSGPRGLPLIGNIHQLHKTKPHHTITHWSNHYGSVYQLFFFGKRVVVVNDFDSIYEVLVSKSADFAGRPESFRMTYQQQGTGFVFLDPSPKAQALRKLTHTHLKAYADGMEHIEKIMLQSGDAFIQDLVETKGCAIDPRKYIYHATTSMMFLLILGEHFQEGDPEFQRLKDIEDSQNLGLSPGLDGELLDMFPWLRFMGNRTYKLLRHAVENRRSFWREYMSRDQGYGEGEGGVAHAMLKAVIHNDIETENGIQLTDLDVEVAAFNLQVAGSVSTTLNLYCFFNIMLHHPEVAKQIRDDIYDKFGKNHMITSKDRDKLQYSQACILESLRYVSSAPLSIPHRSLVDTSIQGQFIPKDTTIFTNLWKLHHDDSFWADPWKYNPQRFLDSEGRLVPMDHPNRKHLMPFSAGYRKCHGEHFALVRLFVWVNSIILNFDLEPEDPHNLVSCDPQDFDVALGLNPWSYKMKFIPIK